MGRDNINRGRDQFIFNNPQNITIPSAPTERRPPALNTLLESVKREVKERLEQSIHKLLTVELINLGKVVQPNQVESPWRMTFQVREKDPEMLPAETKMALL